MSSFSFRNIGAIFKHDDAKFPGQDPVRDKKQAPVPTNAADIGEMRNKGEKSMRKRLLGSSDKNLKQIAQGALSNATNRAKWNRAAFSPAPSSETGVENPSKNLKISTTGRQLLAKKAPELQSQLNTLAAQGWTVEEQRLGNISDYRAKGRIVIDAGLAKKNPELFLSILARHAGVALNSTPVSLASREAFMQTSLEKEAAGALNVMALNDAMAGRGEKRRLPVEPAFNNAHNNAATSGPDSGRAQRMAESVRTGDGPALALRKHLDAQYSALGITPQTRPEAVQRSEDCFNRLGVLIPAERLAVFTTTPEGRSLWMDTPFLNRIVRYSGPSFTGLGIPPAEIGNFIGKALEKGDSTPGANDDLAIAYHDPALNRTVQLYVTMGQKPGQIGHVSVSPIVRGYLAKNKEGAIAWINLGNRTPEQNNAAANQCQLHGINPIHIPSLLQTGIMTGEATALPTDEANNIRTRYDFTYEHKPMSIVVAVNKESGVVEDFDIAAPASQPAQIATATTAPSLDAIAAKAGEPLATFAAQFGVTGAQLIEALNQPSNRQHGSLEAPGFVLYRGDVNGKSAQLMLRHENGAVSAVQGATPFDSLLGACPLQEKKLRELQNEGWQIGFTDPGGGTYCSPSRKKIAMGYPAGTDPNILLNGLAHEMAHARYVPPSSYTDVEAYLYDSARDEGNSMLTEYELLNELPEAARPSYHALLQNIAKKDAPLAANIFQTLQDARANATTDTERLEAEETARNAFGKMYSNFTPSTNPNHTSYQDHWRAFYNKVYGDTTPSHLIGELNKNIPGMVVTDMFGKLWDPAPNVISFIKKLPARESASGEKKPEHFFIPEDIMYQNGAGRSHEAFEAVLRNALDYCKPEITADPNSSDGEMATYSYSHMNTEHEVKLHFDQNGRVFNIEHDAREKVPAGLPSSAVKNTPQPEPAVTMQHSSISLPVKKKNSVNEIPKNDEWRKAFSPDELEAHDRYMKDLNSLSF